MPFWVPGSGPQAVVHANVGSLQFSGTFCNAGGEALLKGAWVEMIASSAKDACGLVIFVNGNHSAGGATPGVIDIGIGGTTDPAAVLIRDLQAAACPYWFASVQKSGCVYHFPLFLPAGSRLAARFGNASGSGGTRVAIWLMGKPRNWSGFMGSRVTTYGPQGSDIDHTPANSRGVAVTAATYPNYGTAAEIVASTSRAIKGLQLGAGVNAATTVNNGGVIAKILVGGSGIIEGLPLSTGTGENIDFALANLILSRCTFAIPAGSALSVATQADAGTPVNDFFLYGVD